MSLNQSGNLMDKNQSIGLVLLLGIMMTWFYITAPSEAEIVEQQRIQDSIAFVKQNPKSQLTDTDKEGIQETFEVPDSVKQAQLQSNFGSLANAAQGQSKIFTLENEKLKIQFDSKGGVIKEAILKDFKKQVDGEQGEDQFIPLKLLDDDKNVFEYILPIKGKGNISTNALFFNGAVNGNSLVFTADAGNGASIVQEYTIGENYFLDYNFRINNAPSIINAGTEDITLRWHQYLDKIEKNVNFEKYYSSVYFKTKDDDSDYCNCRGDAEEEVEENNIHWFSHVNQFFNTSLIKKDASMKDANFEVVMIEDSDDMKLTKSQVKLPLGGNSTENMGFNMYIGPNDFDLLRSKEVGLEEVIPFGRSLFGSINRWVIRPSFEFLSTYIGSKGVVIIVLIFILKMLLYPLMFKMLKSQASMQALKPELAGLKDKFKDEPQKIQMETMKIYREYGVSPLGGCMPMLLQMPIWYALFRFFPASITFRQEPFLWATDLSSYDVIANLPFEIPAFGAHISLFTILWAISTVAYTYYNTKHMDMSANPAMVYVQYLMPIMFLVFFNNYASGLTCYMFFSNLFNIMQTVITKKFVFSNDKIRAELMKAKDKPKKAKSGFQARLEEAMKQQQEVKKKRDNQQASKKKKK